MPSTSSPKKQQQSDETSHDPSVGGRSDKELEAEAVIKRGLQPGCICQGIRLRVLMAAIEAGATTVEDVVRRTGIGQGSCGGRRCRAKAADLLAAYQTGDEQG